MPKIEVKQEQGRNGREFVAIYIDGSLKSRGRRFPMTIVREVQFLARSFQPTPVEVEIEDAYTRALWFAHDEENAVKPGPGKYEGNKDERLAELLDEISGQGCDEEFGSVDEDGAWCGRIGRFIVEEDDRGFFSYGVYMDEEVAKAAFKEMSGENDEDDEKPRVKVNITVEVTDEQWIDLGHPQGITTEAWDWLVDPYAAPLKGLTWLGEVQKVERVKD